MRVDRNTYTRKPAPAPAAAAAPAAAPANAAIAAATAVAQAAQAAAPNAPPIMQVARRQPARSWDAPGVTRQRTMSVSSMATINGCCGLFDQCADADLMSLSFEGTQPFPDWLGWERTDVCVIKREFIAWVRPEYSEGSATEGYVEDPCADPNSVDWGKCDFTLTDFARLRREGPVRDLTYNDIRYCETTPRWRLDGSRIDSDQEYDIRLVTEVMIQDLNRMLINGNAGTSAAQFDGLERLVKTGYTNSNGESCAMMDSTVVNWAGNTVDGGAGITWNGAAVGATYDLVDVLLEIYRNIRRRLMWTPALASTPLAQGDMILLMPHFMVDCLLNAYTCWSVCPGQAYREANLNTYEARKFRNELNGGMFGAGQITLDSFTIPILPYDWGLIKGGNLGDMYLLTGQVGSVKLMQGQYKDMATVDTAYPGALFASTDGGRLLTWTVNDHTCVKQVAELRPRLLLWAPWAQARIQNVFCGRAGPVISSDPTSPYFPIPETGFYSPVCP